MIMAKINIVEDSETLPGFSLHLSRVLDRIGLNTLTVERRRHACIFKEHFAHVCKNLALKYKCTKYYFGSQVEGTTTPGLNSDIDMLLCDDIINVIQHLNECETGMRNVLMLEENMAPGYCRLQVIGKDEPIFKKDKTEELFRISRHYVSDQILLKNSFFINPEFDEIRNGPATTFCNVPGFIDEDRVRALKCKRWPRQAEEFTRRKRRGSWPSKALIHQAISHGVFLVPVGHKLSSSEELEWRISPSMAERCLMFSLNIVQIKVYVVLKMLVKTFIQPVVRHSISSYHCKTVVLYRIEQTSSSFWREDNIVSCIRECMLKLVICVAKGSCPHFIISKENLFDGKVTFENKCTLLSILSYMIRNIDLALLQVRFDSLGYHLKTRSQEPLLVKQLQGSLVTIFLVGMTEYVKNIGSAECKVDFLVKMNQLDTESAIARVSAIASARLQHSDVIDYLSTLSDETEQQAVESFAEFLLCWIGSMHSSLLLSSNMDIPHGALNMITPVGDSSNVTHLLKLASVLYCNGKYTEAESTLNTIAYCYNRYQIRAVCGCSDRSAQGIDFKSCSMVMANTTDGPLRSSTTTSLFAECVIFSKQESYCTPNALRYEYCRSFGDDIEVRHPDWDCWMDLAVVDCLPFLCYLRCITYNKLQNHDLQEQSLKCLILCAKSDVNLGHPETAWNLAGACCEYAGKYNDAIDCYKKSLEIAPRNNAANWHLSTLVYKQIMRDGLIS